MSKKEQDKKSRKRLIQISSSNSSVHTEVLEDIDISCDFDIDQYKFNKKQSPKNPKASGTKINPVQQIHHEKSKEIVQIEEKNLISKTPSKPKTISPVKQIMSETSKKAKQTPSQLPKQQPTLMSFFNKSAQEKTSQQKIPQTSMMLNKNSAEKLIQNLSEQSEIPQEIVEEQQKILRQIREKQTQRSDQKGLNLRQLIKQNVEYLQFNEKEIEEQNEILAQIKYQQSKKSSEKDVQKKNPYIQTVPEKQQQKVENKQPLTNNQSAHSEIPVKKGFKNIIKKDLQVEVIKNDILQHKQPLQGQKIVITGLMNSYPRDKLKNKLEELGAKCVGSVSGQTTLLIAGEKLEDGRPAEQGNKYTKAIEQGVKIIRENDLNVWFEENVGVFIDEVFGESDLTKLYQKSYEIWLNKDQPAITQSENKMLQWTDHYQPRHLKELMGNRSAVDQLREWLVNWGKKIDAPKEKKNFFMMMQLGRFQITGDKYSKACMISGPPGIGKSSTVHLIAQALGLSVMETNASEQRNKKSVRNQIAHLVGNKLLFQNKVSEKFIIVMDEVDGMTGSDRGGIQELIEAIKHTQVPIICICNDNENQKLKSLITHCYHIRFIKPSIQSVVDRLEYICKDQKILMSTDQLKGVAQVFDCDIRQAINFLQLMHNTKRKDQKPSESFSKDQVAIMNQFEAAQHLLNREQREKLKLREQLDMFFLDYELMPLIIQDSYLNAFKRKPKKKESKKQSKKETKKQTTKNTIEQEAPKDTKKDEEKNYSIQEMNKLALASELIAQGDIVNRRIRYQQQWSLMPSYGLLSTIMPCDLVGEEINFPKFPEFWGKNSTKRRITKELQIIKTAIAPVTYNASAKTVRFEYGPILFRMMKRILKKNFHHNDQEASWAVVELLEHFNLTPEDLKTNLMDIQFNPSKKDNLLIDIDASIKTNLTKLFNKRHQIYKLQGKKPKGRKNSGEEKIQIINQYNPVIGEEAPVIDEVEKQNLEKLEEDLNKIESPSPQKIVKRKVAQKQRKQPAKNQRKDQPKKKQKSQESQSEEEDESSLSGFIVDDSDNLY